MIVAPRRTWSMSLHLTLREFIGSCVDTARGIFSDYIKGEILFFMRWLKLCFVHFAQQMHERLLYAAIH